MSNLGTYQVVTTMAKKVGGMRNFIGLLFGGGAAVGAGLTVGGTAIARKRKRKKEAFKLEEYPQYSVFKAGVSNKGLKFAAGDTFRVLEQDQDAVLIYKDGIEDNPHFVSATLLRDISNFR